MTREQMIAWLAIEGWVPWKLKKAALSNTDQALSVVRGTTRIESRGSKVIPNTTWVGGGREHDKTPAEWDEFTLVELENIYEKARLL